MDKGDAILDIGFQAAWQSRRLPAGGTMWLHCEDNVSNASWNFPVRDQAAPFRGRPGGQNQLPGGHCIVLPVGWARGSAFLCILNRHISRWQRTRPDRDPAATLNAPTASPSMTPTVTRTASPTPAGSGPRTSTPTRTVVARGTPTAAPTPTATPNPPFTMKGTFNLNWTSSAGFCQPHCRRHRVADRSEHRQGKRNSDGRGRLVVANPQVRPLGAHAHGQANVSSASRRADGSQYGHAHIERQRHRRSRRTMLERATATRDTASSQDLRHICAYAFR